MTQAFDERHFSQYDAGEWRREVQRKREAAGRKNFSQKILARKIGDTVLFTAIYFKQYPLDKVYVRVGVLGEEHTDTLETGIYAEELYERRLSSGYVKVKRSQFWEAHYAKKSLTYNKEYLHQDAIDEYEKTLSTFYEFLTEQQRPRKS